MKKQLNQNKFEIKNAVVIHRLNYSDILVLFNYKYIQRFIFSGSKKKKRSKKKDKDGLVEAEIKHNDIEVHEEQKCEELDEKPTVTVGKRSTSFGPVALVENYSACRRNLHK